jgi:hypothetical protein
MVTFAGAMRAKPANNTIIHSTSIAKNGGGIEPRRCENNKKRDCISSLATRTILRGVRAECRR